MRQRHPAQGTIVAAATLAGLAGIAAAQCDPDSAFTNPAVLDHMTGFGTSGDAEFIDVTGDGNLDLVVGQNDVNLDAEPDPAGLAIFPGDGEGGFDSPYIVGTDGGTDPSFTRSGPRSIAGADLDGDGDTDLAIGSLSIEVLFNDGSGNFSDPATSFGTGAGEGMNDIDVGDMDGDGDIDIIATDTGGSLAVVAFNDGEGNFSTGDAAFVPASRPTATKAGDFDNDGDLDLAIGNSQADPPSVTIALNDGSGGFSSPTTFGPLSGGPEDLDVGDFDGDGNLDVVTTNGNQDDGVDVLFGNGDGTLGSPQQVTVPGVDVDQGFPLAFEVDAGDIDGDGIDDVAVGVFGLSFDPDALSRVGVLLSNGDGTFSTGQAEAPEAVDRGRRVDLGDINGDGLPEVVLSGSSFSGDTVAVFENGCGGGDDCPADLTGDGSVGSDDFLAYIDLFAAGDPEADFTGDGMITSADFLAYIDAFAAGCP